MFCFTQSIYAHPTLICRGTDSHTDGRTDGRTENIYSVVRDKLLLLGEHVYEFHKQFFAHKFNFTR